MTLKSNYLRVCCKEFDLQGLDHYLGAEHSDGAVDGGVDVGVIIAAHGSKPRLKHRTLCL